MVNLHLLSMPVLHMRPSYFSMSLFFTPVPSSQGYWVFFVVEGNGPLSSIYKALQVIDFYLGFILPCHPIFGMDVSVSLETDLQYSTARQFVLEASLICRI